MAFTIQHQVDLPVETLLRAKLKELTVREIPTREGGSFERLTWVFEITQQGDFFGKTVRGETSAYFSDSEFNQPTAWAKVLLNRDLDAGQVLSEGDLIGLPCDLTVKYEEDRKDKSKKWARVEDIYPVDGLGDEPPF